MKPKATKLLTEKASVHFSVQTTFPGAYGEDKDSRRFGNYIASAYIHIDTATKLVEGKHKAYDEHMAIYTHPDIFVDGDGARMFQGMHFKSAERAFTVAAFIRDHCHLMAGYKERTDWAKGYRQPIKTRVVMVSSRETVHLVEEQ